MLSIIKADGNIEEFSIDKLVRSLVHAGTPESTAREIAESVEAETPDRSTSYEIYRRAFQKLRQLRPVAARYSLKRAVFDFGPSGFPFEKYLAEIFRMQGYTASTDRIIRGHCVEHEVDVFLERKGDTPESVYIEAKFHNKPGFKTDEQTSLYVQARVEDIRAGLPKEESARARGMLVTNTKFTYRAIQYATCKSLGLLAWEYPEKGNLHDLIEQTKQYPITILTSLSGAQKLKLLTSGVVLCRDVATRPDTLRSLGISRQDVERAQQESLELNASWTGSKE